MQVNYDELLHIISFFFTILIILLAIIRGMNNIELILNILYFSNDLLPSLSYRLDKRGVSCEVISQRLKFSAVLPSGKS